MKVQAPQSQEEHLSAKSRTLLISVQVNRPYKELLSDLVLLEKFSLALLLMHKPLISPNWDRGILCCVICCAILISCTLLFQIQFFLLST